MHHWRLAAASLAAVIALSHVSLAAQAPAKPGTVGHLDVEYLIEGKYSGKNQTDTTDWRVKRNLKVTYELYAGELAKYGMSDPEHSEQVKADSEALSAEGQAVGVNNADLMAKVQQAMEACGDDEACIEKAAMQMAQQRDTRQQLQNMSKDVKEVAGHAKAMDAKSPPRYQLWLGKEGKNLKFSGNVALEESLHQTVYDPGCFKTKNICTYDRARKAAYPLDASATTLAPPTVEVDTAKEAISVLLSPPVLIVKVDEKTEEGATKAEVSFAGRTPGDLIEQLKFIGVPGSKG
ncbi:MAG: hypothetical protein WCF16_07910, partial [Alphaproteobacteria bacterium]